MQQDKTYYYLDLGDLGEHEAEVVFNWYKTKVQREDDYDELDIYHIYVMLGEVKVDVIQLVTKDSFEYIKEACWASVEEEK